MNKAPHIASTTPLYKSSPLPPRPMNIPQNGGSFYTSAASVLIDPFVPPQTMQTQLAPELSQCEDLVRRDFRYAHLVAGASKMPMNMIWVARNQGGDVNDRDLAALRDVAWNEFVKKRFLPSVPAGTPVADAAVSMLEIVRSMNLQRKRFQIMGLHEQVEASELQFVLHLCQAGLLHTSDYRVTANRFRRHDRFFEAFAIAVGACVCASAPFTMGVATTQLNRSLQYEYKKHTTALFVYVLQQNRALLSQSTGLDEDYVARIARLIIVSQEDSGVAGQREEGCCEKRDDSIRGAIESVQRLADRVERTAERVDRGLANMGNAAGGRGGVSQEELGIMEQKMYERIDQESRKSNREHEEKNQIMRQQFEAMIQGTVRVNVDTALHARPRGNDEQLRRLIEAESKNSSSIAGFQREIEEFKQLLADQRSEIDSMSKNAGDVFSTLAKSSTDYTATLQASYKQYADSLAQDVNERKMEIQRMDLALRAEFLQMKQGMYDAFEKMRTTNQDCMEKSLKVREPVPEPMAQDADHAGINARVGAWMTSTQQNLNGIVEIECARVLDEFKQKADKTVRSILDATVDTAVDRVYRSTVWPEIDKRYDETKRHFVEHDHRIKALLDAQARLNVTLHGMHETIRKLPAYASSDGVSALGKKISDVDVKYMERVDELEVLVDGLHDEVSQIKEDPNASRAVVDNPGAQPPPRIGRENSGVRPPLPDRVQITLMTKQIVDEQFDAKFQDPAVKTSISSLMLKDEEFKKRVELQLKNEMRDGLREIEGRVLLLESFAGTGSESTFEQFNGPGNPRSAQYQVAELTAAPTGGVAAGSGA